MSTTSSGRDHIPSDKSNLRSRMCLFVDTRKDGTPFNATSVTEEDIVKIWITMGHTHPLAVLCYSAMESVALFHSTEEMQCTTCAAVKAMELQDKAIAIRAVAPSETHIKASSSKVGNSMLSPSRAWQSC